MCYLTRLYDDCVRNKAPDARVRLICSGTKPVGLWGVNNRSSRSEEFALDLTLETVC